MKNVALIVAHCDTQEKIDILNQNLDYLNQFKDKLDIILVSYTPVSRGIQEKIRYFIYDSENPIMGWPEKGIFQSKKFGEITLGNWTIDYGWCIANKIKMAGDLLKDKEYGGVYFMNYDVKLSEPLLNKISEGIPLNETFKGINFAGWVQPICTVFMSFTFETFKKIASKISKKHYMSNSKRVIESYMKELVGEEDQHTLSDIDIYDHIDFNGGNGANAFNSIGDSDLKFKVFQTSYDFSPWDHTVAVDHSFIYDIEEYNKIKINGNLYSLTKGNNLLLPFNIETLEVNLDNEWKDITLENKGNTYLKIINNE